MSGVPRWSPTTLRTPSWYSGREKTADLPPPPAPKPSFHTTSGEILSPAWFRLSCEPPTEVTSGSDDGQELTGNGYRVVPSASSLVTPSSPEDASTVTLCAKASLNAYRRSSRLEKLPLLKPGNVFSVAPKLWVITSPMPWVMSDCSALIISGNPVTPSVSATGVSARTIFAPGAMECEYSTSRVVSSAQPTWVALFGSNGGTFPNFMICRVGSGNPNCWSKWCRSAAMVGDPKESTITMVRPLPVMSRPRALPSYRGFRS